MKTEKRRARKGVPEGYLCFSLNGASQAQRSQYSEKRRKEVHAVRKVGACLRCQLLKKTCSRGNPCTTCLKAASQSSNSRSLAWMECIRPSLSNVSIFGLRSSHERTLNLGGVPVLQYLAHGDVDLAFDIPFQWQIDELTTFVAGWLIMDHDAPRASMVGIMSSASLLALISDLIGSELAQAFKTLISTSSLIFNASEDRYYHSSNDLRVIATCGQKLITHLDSHLRPAALSRLGKHDLYALFILLLGCMMSSRYVKESIGDLSHVSIESNCIDSQTQDTKRATELVRLLSHQMVYIGQTVGLLSSGADKDLIRDLTSLAWRRKPQSSSESDLVFQRYGVEAENLSCGCGDERQFMCQPDSTSTSGTITPRETESWPDSSYKRGQSTEPSHVKSRTSLYATQEQVCPHSKSLEIRNMETYASWNPASIALELPNDQTVFDTTIPIQEMVDWSDIISPIPLPDLNMAILDPKLPTNGFDEFFLEWENVGASPCLNRVPTPIEYGFLV